MRYITTKQAAKKWKIGERRVRFFCSENKIPGAKNVGHQWLIPDEAKRPIDGRTKRGKAITKEYEYHFPMLVHSFNASDINDLDEDYKNLYNAQLLYVQGKHAASVKLCLEILNNNVFSPIKFGVFITLAYNNLALGLNDKMNESLRYCKAILAKETTHREDYKLILATFYQHIGIKVEKLYLINQNELSNEGRNYLYIMISLFGSFEKKNSSKGNTVIQEIIAYRVEAQDLKLDTFVLRGVLACEYVLAKDIENANKQIKYICEATIKNSWFGYLSKFYYRCLPYSANYIKENYPSQFNSIEDYIKRRFTAWQLIIKSTRGFTPFENIDPKYFDFLTLVACETSGEDIRTILKIDKKEFNNIINYLKKQLNIDNRKDLVEYLKNNALPATHI